MRMPYSLGLTLVLVLASVATAGPTNPPKLTVVISIDQFRPDYLTRFYDHYLPARDGETIGGFRFLLAEGANFAEARVGHFPTYTGPGHAAILSGAPPAVNGVIGNVWYDRDRKDILYCVEDGSVAEVSDTGAPASSDDIMVGDAKDPGVSPKLMLGTTVGDELKQTTDFRAKVVGIAYKDRAGVLMAGHRADTVVWMSSETGTWVSSTAYGPELPGWVRAFNDTKPVDAYFGKTWEPLLPEAIAGLSSKPVEESLILAAGMTPAFPHVLKGGNNKRDKTFYKQFIVSGLANEVMTETAIAAIKGESLGADDVPDILALSLSTNDYVGHYYGPNSPEVADITLRTDRELSKLFTHLDQTIGLDEVAIVVTSDHGVVPIPGDLAARGIRAGQVRVAEVIGAVEAALDEKFGDGDWVESFEDSAPHLYLNLETVAAKGADRDEVTRRAAEAVLVAEGVAAAHTRQQILNRKLPPSPFSELIYNGFHSGRSGDVLVITEPNWFIETDRYSTTHGTPYDYDTAVPLLVYRKGLYSGSFYRPVTTMDIAPTLSRILGIGAPSGNQGRLLKELFPSGGEKR